MVESRNNAGRLQSSRSIYSIALAGVFLAMAMVLATLSNFIPFLSFANGGSISFAMVPLLLASLILGPIWGTGIGIAFGAFDIALGGFYGWESLFLDYLIPFGIVGVCGFLRRYYYQNKTWSLVVGMLIFGVLRFISHFLSGCILFNSYASEEGFFGPGGVIYSLGYNSGYIIPSVTLGIIALLALARPLFSMNSTHMMKTLNPYSKENVATFDRKDNSYVHYILIGLLVVTSLMGIIGSIPAQYGDVEHETLSFMGYYYLGYIGLAVNILILAYLIYLILKEKKEESAFVKDGVLAKIFKKPLYLYYALIVLTVISMGVNALAIASYFTYAKDLYQSVA